LIRKKPFKANEQVNCFLISGSMVMEGTGSMLVLAVGVNSRNGKLKQDLQEKEEITPLQLKLEGVVDQIGTIGQWCAIATFGGMTIHLFIEKMVTGVRHFKAS
jgi:Ca2+ transporting ATPase